MVVSPAGTAKGRISSRTVRMVRPSSGKKFDGRIVRSGLRYPVEAVRVIDQKPTVLGDRGITVAQLTPHAFAT